ncbi:PAS domain S-box protein [Phenylobacterium sp.]|uniref:PAS domain S-box protein n=1 Tax=Phenylobacterium sp. TaxID=1871053 RepID=UPI0025F10990|nr:PAS domain S-box protein [Phenylobacterium sp.]
MGPSGVEDAFVFIAEHTNDVIVRVDADGRIRFVSESARRYGYAPEDVIGTPFLRLAHPADAEALAQATAALLRGELDTALRRQHRFRAADGAWVWMEGNPHIVRGPGGDVVEIVNIFRDVTRRRELEDAATAQAELFEAAFRSVAGGIAILSPDGVVRRANPAWRRIAGRDKGEAVGLRMATVVHPEDMARVRDQARALLRGDIDSYESDERYVRPDGSFVWVRVTASCVRDAGGQPLHIVSQVQDLTAQRAAEEALRERGAQLREQAELFESSFDNAPIGMALVGTDGSFLRINDAFCRITDYPRARMLALDFQTITHPEDLNADLEQLTQLTAGVIDGYRMDKRYIRADGEIVWVHLSVSMVRNADGSPKHYVAQVQDLTERRAAEAALRGSEARYRLIADKMTDVIVQMDAEGRITWVSPSVAAYGYEPDTLLGLTTDQIVHPDDYHRIMAGRAPGSDHRGDQQARYRAADGRWVWMEGNPQEIRNEAGEITGAINVLRNVTERRAQADLFETAFQQAAIGKCLVELDSSIFKVNHTLCLMLGFPEAELLGLNGDDLMHPEERGAGDHLIAELVSGEIDSYSRERRFRKADGGYLWCGMTIAMVRNPDGSPKHYVVELRDLTEQRAAEMALRESEARYRMITENTSDMIIMSDLSGKAIYVSPNVRASGTRPEEIEGSSFAENMHPDDARQVERAFMKLVKGGGSTRVRWRARNRATGAYTWLESNPTLVRDPETGAPTGFLDVIRDIDLQVAQEAEIAEATAAAEAAAAAKSQFLANMSHEIRTPLTAVLGFTSLLSEMELPETAERYVGRISGAGNALLAIVNDILDFSKLEAGKFEIRPKPVDVATVCEETLQLFSTQAQGKGLSLAFAAQEDLPRVAMVDGDRLRQMLINLVGNAVKFSDEGGVTLTVAQAAKADWIRIEVADTGPGLDAEAQALLFQRFTQIDGSMTRRHGGTGLGLAISRGIAEAMGGEIGVTSTPGQGARFFVEIPAPASELRPELAGEEAAVARIDGTRVFVVDDNPVNRELSRRILEAAGAEVYEAGDGGEAVERLGLLPVDVVLMDLRMPGVDGRAALGMLRELAGPNQDVPVLAFTADADLAGENDLAGFDGLVRKPIHPADMYAAIAAATAWASPDEAGEIGGPANAVG